MTVFVSQYETLGVDAANSGYINVTANAAVNTKGAWQSFGLTTFDWTGFDLVIPRSIGTVCLCLIDIAIGDGAGNFSSFLVQNILSGPNPNRYSHQRTPIPMFVAAGTELLIRFQAAVGASTQTKFALYGRNEMYPPRIYRSCDTYGADIVNTVGVVVDPGAVTNAKGAWTTIGTCARDYDCFLWAGKSIGYPATPSGSDGLLDLGLGTAGNPATIIPNLSNMMQSSQVSYDPETRGPFYARANSGDVIQARTQCQIATAGSREIYMTAHAFYNPIAGTGGNYARRGLVRV